MSLEVVQSCQETTTWLARGPVVWALNMCLAAYYLGGSPCRVLHVLLLHALNTDIAPHLSCW
jgi:hypothetical protein